METWETAFLKQARSDMAVFEEANRYPLCQQLHYLQMATEKLAKAYWSRENNGKRPPGKHTAFVDFLRRCGMYPRIRDAFGMGRRQFREFTVSLLAKAHEVENLAAAGDVDKPNPEYPWQENGAVVAPVDYPFPGLSLTSTQMVKLLRLIDVCMAMADENARPQA